MRGGDIADVSLLTLKDGRNVVAKRPRADQPDTTEVEAMMLRHLAAHAALPVPDVLFQKNSARCGTACRRAAWQPICKHSQTLRP